MADDLSQFLIKAETGTVLFRQGDPGDTMFFIHSGRVRIEIDVDGRSEVLAHLEKGDFFGEMAILDRSPRSATAIVEENAELLKVDQANFEKLLHSNIEIAVRMIRKYIARLREANERLEGLMKDRKELDRGIVDILESVKKQQETPAGSDEENALAFLTHPKSAARFLVTKAQVLVGRIDPVTNIVPDVDLTALDDGRSVSRRHARIEYIDKEFYLWEEVGVANGTFLNGKRLRAGDPVPLKTGSRVQFGQVELLFQPKISN